MERKNENWNVIKKEASINISFSFAVLLRLNDSVSDSESPCA